MAGGAGAACLPDGGLEVSSLEVCNAASGEFHQSQQCIESGCKKPGAGACCFWGDCAIAQEYQCSGTGKVWHTEGSICIKDLCTQAGAKGACCFADKTCAAGITEPECGGLLGSYAGDATTCDACPK